MVKTRFSNPAGNSFPMYRIRRTTQHITQTYNRLLTMRSVEKVHRIIKFKQKALIKPYIDYNTEKRKHAVGTFAKDFCKLMNNSVFVKTMESVRNIVSIAEQQMVKSYESIQG